MKPLLQNLAEMTAHRDHLRLEMSVLSTLLLQGRMLQVRALELFTRGGEAWLRPRSWSQDGGELLSSLHEPSTDPQAAPLASLPELAQCIAGKGRDAARDEPGRHTLWLPVWQGDHAHACLEVVQA